MRCAAVAGGSAPSYSVWGLPQPIGQQKPASTVLPGLGGAWGAGPPLAPLGGPAGPSSAGLPSAPSSAGLALLTAQLPTPPAASGPALPAASTSPIKVAVPPPTTTNGPWVAKCKGLPFSATIETIVQFFDGLAIADDGIRIRTNEQGVPKGECLVIFAAEGALSAALERTRQVMGHKFVTVQLADAAEVADVFPPACPPPPVPPPAPAPTRAAAPAPASARGPASPSKPSSAATANGGKGNGGKGGALPYISAATAAPPATAGAPAAAVTAAPGGKGGSSASGKGGGKGGGTGGKGGDTGGKGGGGSHRAAAAESTGAGANGSGSGDANGSCSGGASTSGSGGGGNIVIKMRGLPYSTTEQEIADFFPGIKIASGGVSIGRDASGRASGEAHVEFATDQDAQSAMLLNRQQMGSRYIELFRMRQPPSAVRKEVTSTATEGTGGSSDSLRLRGMPFKSTEADVQTFFKGCVSSGVSSGVAPASGARARRRHTPASLSHVPIPAHEAWLLPLLLRRPRRRTPSADEPRALTTPLALTNPKHWLTGKPRALSLPACFLLAGARSAVVLRHSPHLACGGV